MDNILNTMYAKLPNLILGFHGCSSETYKNILHKHQHLKKSDNTYDWLGNGIYFWENSYQRAYEWAVNPNCIKGYFAPLSYNEEYNIP